jgi:hypothetical protein
MWAVNIVTNCTGLAYFLCERYPQIRVCPVNILDQLFKKPRHLHIMLTEGSFPCAQEPVTAPHLEQAESSLHSHT